MKTVIHEGLEYYTLDFILENTHEIGEYRSLWFEDFDGNKNEIFKRTMKLFCLSESSNVKYHMHQFSIRKGWKKSLENVWINEGRIFFNSVISNDWYFNIKSLNNN
jgi:hypothetical protein